MRVALKNLTEIASRHIKCFDLHEEFGLAYLVDEDDTATLYLNDRECRSWLKGDYPYLEHVRWFGQNAVIAWYRDQWEAVIISDKTWKKLTIGSPHCLLLSENYIFVSYYEEGVRSPSDLLYLHHVVCAFTREGAFKLGLEDLMTANNFRDSFIEIEAGYAFDDHLVFVTCCLPDGIWILNVPEKRLRRILVPFSTVALAVVTGNAKKAYAIYDNRPLLYYHKDLPAFEFAVFDLKSETSSKEDFAVIEKPLIEADFETSALNFQANSTGKIIATDGVKAALLEFSEAA
jgi:hypothetical protein